MKPWGLKKPNGGYYNISYFSNLIVQELTELDGSKTNGMSSRIASLESENEELRRTVIKICFWFDYDDYYIFR